MNIAKDKRKHQMIFLLVFSSIVYGGTSAFFPYEGTRAFFKICKVIQATIYDPKRDTAGYLYQRTFPIDGKITSANSRAQKYEILYSGNFLETIYWQISSKLYAGKFLETIC